MTYNSSTNRKPSSNKIIKVHHPQKAIVRRTLLSSTWDKSLHFLLPPSSLHLCSPFHISYLLCHNVAVHSSHNSSLKRRTDWSGCPGFELGDKYKVDRPYTCCWNHRLGLCRLNIPYQGACICDTGPCCGRQYHQKCHVSRLHTTPTYSALSRDYQPSSLKAFLVADKVCKTLDHTLHSPLSHSSLSLLKHWETLLK